MRAWDSIWQRLLLLFRFERRCRCLRVIARETHNGNIHDWRDGFDHVVVACTTREYTCRDRVRHARRRGDVTKPPVAHHLQRSVPARQSKGRCHRLQRAAALTTVFYTLAAVFIVKSPRVCGSTPSTPRASKKHSLRHHHHHPPNHDQNACTPIYSVGAATPRPPPPSSRTAIGITASVDDDGQ